MNNNLFVNCQQFKFKLIDRNHVNFKGHLYTLGVPLLHAGTALCERSSSYQIYLTD